jgi:hypothetical protein
MNNSTVYHKKMLYLRMLVAIHVIKFMCSLYRHYTARYGGLDQDISTLMDIRRRMVKNLYELAFISGAAYLASVLCEIIMIFLLYSTAKLAIGRRSPHRRHWATRTSTKFP